MFVVKFWELIKRLCFYKISVDWKLNYKMYYRKYVYLEVFFFISGIFFVKFISFKFFFFFFRVSIWGLGFLLLVFSWFIIYLMLVVVLLILWIVLLCFFRCFFWIYLKYINNVLIYFMNVIGLIMIKMRF